MESYQFEYNELLDKVKKMENEKAGYESKMDMFRQEIYKKT